MDTARPGRSLAELFATAERPRGASADELFIVLYDELHALAERQLRGGGAAVPLGTTTLLHEAYLNLAAREGIAFPDRPRFLAYAARAMRGLVVDYARRRRAAKRGGAFEILSLATDDASADAPGHVDVEALAQALEALGEADPALAELVDLHFFSGFSLIEIAELRGISRRTVQRDWRKARLLLAHAMAGDGLT